MGATRETVEDIGRSGITLLEAFRFIFRGRFHIGETAEQINKAGIGSVFIVSITAMFIGLAMSTQLAKELYYNFGAGHLVGGLVAIAIIRELAPVITAIVVAGRVGASISAEIGSMKASEQIDALRVLGINPTYYLFVPRLIASSIITPLLTVISAFVSILSGMVLTGFTIGLSNKIYLDSVRQFIGNQDVWVMLLKAAVFGLVISVIATTRGFSVVGGAEAVGKAATSTVVWSIILIFILNYVLTSIFFGA
jgi:phospholipid/cholesterol/gamma-HCH transport system permease protein